jgi:hypothetical protein
MAKAPPFSKKPKARSAGKLRPAAPPFARAAPVAPMPRGPVGPPVRPPGYARGGRTK